MSIKPFVDRPKINIDQKLVADPTATSGMDTSQIDQYRQGVSIRDMSDYGKTMNPIFTSKGLPALASQKIDFSLEISSYGQPKEFEDLGNTAPFNGKFLPFHDIIGILSPKDFIEDSGNQMYPNVMLDPGFNNPSDMDGVIEPLTIRHKLSNTNAEGPFVAHDTRAAMMPTVGNEIAGNSTFINQYVEFSPGKNPPYFDSQDTPMEITSPSGTKFVMSFPGFDYPEQNNVSPYDDSKVILNSEFSILNAATGSAMDAGGFGVYRMSADAGFIYRQGCYNINQDLAITGQRRVVGTDSLAFGGLVK